MADLINIDSEEARKKLQIINRNFMVIIVITFALAIAYLYHQQQAINSELINYLMNDVQNTTKIIEQNNKIVENNSNLLQQLVDEKKN